MANRVSTQRPIVEYYSALSRGRRRENRRARLISDRHGRPSGRARSRSPASIIKAGRDILVTVRLVFISNLDMVSAVSTILYTCTYVGKHSNYPPHTWYVVYKFLITAIVKRIRGFVCLYGKSSMSFIIHLLQGKYLRAVDCVVLKKRRPCGVGQLRPLGCGTGAENAKPSEH